MDDNVVAIAPKKKFVRVITKQGFVIDLDMPSEFSMIGFSMSIRASGCLLNDLLFLPLDQIATVFVWTEDAPPQGQHCVIPFTGKPT